MCKDRLAEGIRQTDKNEWKAYDRQKETGRRNPTDRKRQAEGIRQTERDWQKESDREIETGRRNPTDR